MPGTSCPRIRRATSTRCWSLTCAASCSTPGARNEEAQRQPPFVPEGRRRRRDGVAVLPVARELGGAGGGGPRPAPLLRYLPPARHRGRILRDAGRPVLG